MRRRLQLTAVVVVVAVLGVVGAAVATGGRSIHEKLTGYQEQPLALSTTGSGKFEASFSRFGDKFTYRLSYRDLEGDVTQAHIHFGEENQVGGVSVFLCTNLGNGPAGTQPCPAPPATISGTIVAADVTNLANERGISAGELEELIRAIRAGVTYVNVHSTRWPGGEIRSQVDGNHSH